MVVEYIKCRPGTKFDLVKIRVAVDATSVIDDSLSVIIRYKTAYFVTSCPLLLSFVLGNNLPLNTILGTPVIEMLKCLLDLGDRTLNFWLVNKILHLTMQDPGLGHKGVLIPLPGNFSVPSSI